MQLKKNLLSIAASALLVAIAFMSLEPIVTPAEAVTDSVGVTQEVTSDITISSPSDVSMSQALTTTQNTATGSATWNVKTNDSDGYTLTLFASTAPALSRGGGGGNIVDYTPAVSETPETWSVSAAAEFGWSGFGTDVNTTTYGTDADCLGAGAHDYSTALKYRDFDLTGSQDTIASSAAATSTSGTDTTMCLATQQNGIYAVAGTYTGTVTATATAN